MYEEKQNTTKLLIVKKQHILDLYLLIVINAFSNLPKGTLS